MEISETLQRNNQAGHLSESDIMDNGIFSAPNHNVDGIKLNLFLTVVVGIWSQKGLQ